jgi:hypothetical protein
MRILSSVFLFLALGVILAHSVLPHHHHEPKHVSHNKESHHDHEGGKGHHHDADDSESHPHNAFTYSQIENTFLTGKQIIVSITDSPIIEIFEWSVVSINIQEPNNFYLKDIELPPLLRCQEISFRGPPTT